MIHPGVLGVPQGVLDLTLSLDSDGLLFMMCPLHAWHGGKCREGNQGVPGLLSCPLILTLGPVLCAGSQ